jgi:hypothetical protein
MTTWFTMRTVSGAICLDGRAGKSQPPAGSVADIPRPSKFVRASDLRILLLAFLGRLNALHMFHLAMFSEAIVSMVAEVA